jgi:hypothetical protein
VRLIPRLVGEKPAIAPQSSGVPRLEPRHFRLSVPGPRGPTFVLAKVGKTACPTSGLPRCARQVPGPDGVLGVGLTGHPCPGRPCSASLPRTPCARRPVRPPERAHQVGENLQARACSGAAKPAPCLHPSPAPKRAPRAGVGAPWTARQGLPGHGCPVSPTPSTAIASGTGALRACGPQAQVWGACSFAYFSFRAKRKVGRACTGFIIGSAFRLKARNPGALRFIRRPFARRRGIRCTTGHSHHPESWKTPNPCHNPPAMLE